MTDRVGLANLGNTCFLNVVLQALRYSPPIATTFLSDKKFHVREDSNRKEILSAFKTLMEDFWTIDAPPGARPSLIPRGFFHSLHTVLRETGDYWYRPGQQCDAAEALQYILDSLHDAMHRRVRMEISGSPSSAEHESQVKAIKSWTDFFGKEYSPIVANFNGQIQNRVVCSECSNVSERYEPWLMIKAPIPGADVVGGPAPTMSACLGSAFEPEKIDDYACDKCKKRVTATKTERISRLPPVTIVSIKRFTNSGHKVRGLIPWDLDALDFSPWRAFDRDPFTDTRDPSVYSTFAVIEHHGSLNGGHYRMFARDGADWVCYDDSSVYVVPPDAVITADSYIALMSPKHAAAEMTRSMKDTITDLRARRPPPMATEA
jgi:ubiquitin C-terminal hydrolase